MIAISSFAQTARRFSVLILIFTITGVSVSHLSGHTARIYSKSISTCTQNSTYITAEINRAKEKNVYFNKIMLDSFTSCFDKMVYVYTTEYNSSIVNSEQDDANFWMFLLVVFCMIFCCIDRK